jgi:hypothetical protein
MMGVLVGLLSRHDRLAGAYRRTIDRLALGTSAMNALEQLKTMTTVVADTGDFAWM